MNNKTPYQQPHFPNVSNELHAERKLKQFTEAHDINSPWLAWQLIIVIFACLVFVISTGTLLINYHREIIQFVNSLNWVENTIAAIAFISVILWYKIKRSAK